MLKRLLIVACLILGPIPTSFASHDNSGIMTAMAITFYTPTVLAPFNLVDGLQDQGTWIWGLSGIAAGALQLAGGGAAFINTDAETKQVFGPLLAAGALNVGAGVFAILNRRPPAVSISPMVGTEGGMSPGLTLGFIFD